MDSLTGMAVNVKSGLSGHAPKNKVGIIDKVWAGDALEDGAVPVNIEGYLFAKDFPDVVEELQASADELGFSYECDAKLEETTVDGLPVLQVTALVYSGAAILLKDKAAYTRTSLAAEGDETIDMTKEELQAMMDEMADMKGKMASMEDLLSSWKLIKESLEEAGIYSSLSMYLSAAAEQKTAIETLTNQIADVTLKAEASTVKVAELETALTAANEKVAKLEPLAEHVTALKAEADAKAAYDRKSFDKPRTLMAQFGVDETTDLQAEIGDINKRTDLSMEQRIALKMEATARHAAVTK